MDLSVTSTGAPPRPRLAAAAHALAITAAAAMAAALFPTGDAVGGDLGERLVIPVRMLLLVLVATALLRWCGETWGDVGLSRPRAVPRLLGWVAGGYIAIAVAAMVLTQIVFPQFGVQPKTSLAFGAIHGNLGEYLYWLLPVAWGSAAFGEEMVFRGFLQSRLARAFVSSPALLPVVVQALIFGALHAYQGTGGAILAGATGLIIGGVYMLSGRNLWACILLHGLVDTISITALYFGAVPAGV